MSLHLIVPALALAFLSSGIPADDKAKDLDKFQGTWTVVSMEFKGKEAPDAGDKATKDSRPFSTRTR